jgi:hypothetical protein
MKRLLLGGAVAGALVGVSMAAIRPRHLRFGATDDEATAPLPGDELIPVPAIQATRAVSIDAPPAQVWPWIAQLGADKGGFYSYEVLENLVGCQIRNAEEVVRDWQHPRVGDFIRADRKGSGGWYVETVDPPRVLVARVGDPATGQRFTVEEEGLAFTWAFLLVPEPGERTRLLVRARYGVGNPAARVAAEVLEVVDFVMTEKMLRGIRERAERFSLTLAPADAAGTAA